MIDYLTKNLTEQVPATELFQVLDRHVFGINDLNEAGKIVDSILCSDNIAVTLYSDFQNNPCYESLSKLVAYVGLLFPFKEGDDIGTTYMLVHRLTDEHSFFTAKDCKLPTIIIQIMMNRLGLKTYISTQSLPVAQYVHPTLHIELAAGHVLTVDYKWVGEPVSTRKHNKILSHIDQGLRGILDTEALGWDLIDDLTIWNYSYTLQKIYPEYREVTLNIAKYILSKYPNLESNPVITSLKTIVLNTCIEE